MRGFLLGAKKCGQPNLEVEHDRNPITNRIFRPNGFLSGDLGNGEYAAWIMVLPGYNVSQLHLKGINMAAAVSRVLLVHPTTFDVPK